jgi:hypothetical protein
MISASSNGSLLGLLLKRVKDVVVKREGMSPAESGFVKRATLSKLLAVFLGKNSSLSIVDRTE